MVLNKLYERINNAIYTISSKIQLKITVVRDSGNKLKPFKVILSIRYSKFWALKSSSKSFWPTISATSHTKVFTIGRIPNYERGNYEEQKEVINFSNNQLISIGTNSSAPKKDNFKISKTGKANKDADNYNSTDICIVGTIQPKPPAMNLFDYEIHSLHSQIENNPDTNVGNCEMVYNAFPISQNKSDHNFCINKKYHMLNLLFQTTSTSLSDIKSQIGNNKIQNLLNNCVDSIANIPESYELFTNNINSIASQQINNEIYQNNKPSNHSHVDITCLAVFIFICIVSFVIFGFTEWTIKPLYDRKKVDYIIDTTEKIIIPKDAEFLLPTDSNNTEHYHKFVEQAVTENISHDSNTNIEQIESKKIRKTVANSDNYLVENGYEKEPSIKYSLNKKMTKEEEKPVFVEQEGQEQRAQDPAIEILTDFSILYKDENSKEVDLENPLVIYNEVDYTSDSAADSALIPLVEDNTAREISDFNHFNKTSGYPCESINKAYNNPEVPQMPKYLTSHSCNNNWHKGEVKRLKYRSKTDVSLIISSEPNSCLSSTIVTSGTVTKSASKLQYDRGINITPAQPFRNADVDIITNFEHYNKIERFLKIYGNDSCNITASDIDDDKDFDEADKYSNTGTYGGSFEESYDYSFEYHSNYNSDGSFECYSFIYESSNLDDDDIYDIYSLTDKSPKLEDDSIMLAFKDFNDSNDLVSSSNVGLHNGHEKANELYKSNKVQEILNSNISLGNIFKPAVSQNKVKENGKNMFYLDSSKKYNEENYDNVNENINNADDNNKENNKIYSTSSNPKYSSPMIIKSNESNENISELITSDIKQLAVDKLHKLLKLNNSENYAISDSQELKLQCNLITDTYFKEISTSIIKIVGIDHIDDEGKKWIVNDLNSVNKSVFKISEIFSESEELLNNDEKEKLQIPSLFEAYSNRFKILFVQIESDLEDICYQMALIDARIY